MQIHEIHIGGEHPLLEVRGIHIRDVDLADRLDRPRPPPAPAFISDVDQLTEAQDDAALGRFDLEEAACQPQRDHDEPDQQQERATLTAFATRPQQRLELALPVFYAFVQIRTALARPPSPGIVLTAARLIPRHM